MEHKGTGRIQTGRLLLRPFTIDDAPAMYRNWASDEAVTKYLMWPAHHDVSVSRSLLTEWTANYQNPSYYQWAIVFRPHSDEPIGSIGVINEIDDTLKTAHIGYCIGRQWWHMGITSEALRGVIDYLFDEVGLHRIESRHDPRNPHSGAVMRKCGMRYEGTFRQADRNNQGICDASYYAILASDRERNTL